MALSWNATLVANHEALSMASNCSPLTPRKKDTMSKQEFLESLYDSERNLVEAVTLEVESDYDDYEATLDRKYEEGFIDGMRHAYTLLTGDVLIGSTSDEIIEATRELAKATICDHSKFSTTANFCSVHPATLPCYDERCDNCNKVVKHVD